MLSIATYFVILTASLSLYNVDAFTPQSSLRQIASCNTQKPTFLPTRTTTLLRMSEDETSSSAPALKVVGEDDDDDEALMDPALKLQLDKQKRADELRSQEVFMKKSTGRFICNNCDWVYEESKGDSMMIGGMIKPGTPYAELPSNWRCPVCRASKDIFREDVVEIPGFEVNQGYGFGGNSMSGEQKSSLIFGGLFVFFLLFLGGYALS